MDGEAWVATVVPEVASGFAFYLTYLDHRFAELEDIAQSWSELSSRDQNDFLFEWPIVEDNLNTLRALIKQRGLPAQFEAPYRQLEARIARDRSTLERLQAS
jgi:hypothetical protein